MCATLAPPMSRNLRGLVVAAVALAASPVAAQSAAAVVAPAGPGQQALAVAVTKQGITAKLCAAAAGCSAAGGTSLSVPEDVAPLLEKGVATVVPLAGGKHIVRVEVTGAEGAKWLLLVGAPPTSGSITEPIVVARGWTDRVKGEHGEGKSTVVLEDGPAKARRLLVARRREDVTLCGRPTLVNVRALDPDTMTLVAGATVQNLSESERSKAVRVTATRAADPGAPPASPPPAAKPPATAPPATAPSLTGSLLRAEAGSSAVDKKIATLTDGDFQTTWSEDRAGDGQGEFVTMSASSDVGITSIEIAVRPPALAAATPPGKDGPARPQGKDTADGVAPRTFYLVTTDRALHVTMPEDAWQKPGARYEVKLPEEIRTSCLAVVLDTAYGAAGAKNARVTFAEVTARTSLDGMGAAELVGALAGGGERARAAAALLVRMGAGARKAAIAHYDKLDAAGKALAMGIIEAGTCAEQAPFFTEQMGRAAAKAAEEAARKRKANGKSERKSELDAETAEEIDHARDRLRRCGRAAAADLARMVAEAPDAAKVIAASELALIAPADSVPVLLTALASAKQTIRRELRTALAQAAKNERSWPAFAEALKTEPFAARPEVVRIDLLRAIGPSLGRVEGSSPALASLATTGASFRTKYLLLAPAAELARAGDAAAELFLRTTLRTDVNPHLRARAAEVAARVPSLGGDLVAAIDDREVRVRVAAIRSSSHAPAAPAKPPTGMDVALARRLGSDPWTFVRSGAAQALAGMPGGGAPDAALAVALADRSAEVRGHVVDALGARRATAHAPKVRERAEDREETLDVRAKAILALAEMCDREQLDDWTKLASRTATPNNEQDQRLGAAAIAALGRVHPPDLEARLAPLLKGKGAPRAVQEMARAALATAAGCPAR